MFIFYTLLFCLLTYLSYTFNILGFSIISFFLRESYFIYLFILLFHKICFINKFGIKKNGYGLFIFICILMALPYIFISHSINEAIKTYILYFSGPILFLLISNLDLSKKTRHRFEFYFLLVLGAICVLNIFCYFVQGKLINYLPQEFLVNFYRGKNKIRYLGVALHPTFTGFFFVYFIGYLFIVKKDFISSCINGFFFIFTGTRSAVLGIPFYIFLKLKKHLKIITVLFGIIFLSVIYYLLVCGNLSKILEPSANAHLLHLFVLGPKTIVKYPLGIGLGTVSPYNSENSIIHLESEMYLYIIQLGIFSLVLKLIFYGFVIKKLLLVNTRKSNWLLFILLIFLVGCLVFPLNASRFIANFIWIMLGIEFSKPEYRLRLGSTIRGKYKIMKYFLKMRG